MNALAATRTAPGELLACTRSWRYRDAAVPGTVLIDGEERSGAYLAAAVRRPSARATRTRRSPDLAVKSDAGHESAGHWCSRALIDRVPAAARARPAAAIRSGAACPNPAAAGPPAGLDARPGRQVLIGRAGRRDADVPGERPRATRFPRTSRYCASRGIHRRGRRPAGSRWRAVTGPASPVAVRTARFLFHWEDASERPFTADVHDPLCRASPRARRAVCSPPGPRRGAAAEEPRPRELLPRGDEVRRGPQLRGRGGQPHAPILAQDRPDPVRLPRRARPQAGHADARDRLREPAGGPPVHRVPGRGRLLRDRHLPRYPAGRAAHPGRGRPAAQAAAPDPGPGPEAGVPAGRALRRGARAQRVLALPGRGHRGVPGARRAGHEAGRLLRLHLRPGRGRRAPGAARGLLLPDRDPGGAGRPVRPDRTIHDRLGKTSTSAIQATHHPPGRVTIHRDLGIGRKGMSWRRPTGALGCQRSRGPQGTR